MTPEEKLEELAKLQKMIEEVEDWGYGRIEIEIQDGRIVFGEEIHGSRNTTLWVRRYKFSL